MRILFDHNAPRQRHCNSVGHGNGVVGTALPHRFGRCFQAPFHLQDGPDEGRRVPAVECEGSEPVEPQVVYEPVHSSLLGHGCPLVDAPAVADHDGGYQPAVLSPPPAGRPVAASLLPEGAITEEDHQSFARQGHVNVLELGKSQIASLYQGAGGVGVDVASKGRVLPAIHSQDVGVEVPDVAAFTASTPSLAWPTTSNSSDRSRIT